MSLVKYYLLEKAFEMLCVGDGWNVEEWRGFSICLADTISPWDGDCPSLKVNACQNGAMFKEGIFKVKNSITFLFAQHLTRNLISRVVYRVSLFSKHNVVSLRRFQGCYFVIKLVLCRESICSFQRCLFSLYSDVKKSSVICIIIIIWT